MELTFQYSKPIKSNSNKYDFYKKEDTRLPGPPAMPITLWGVFTIISSSHPIAGYLVCFRFSVFMINSTTQALEHMSLRTATFYLFIFGCIFWSSLLRTGFLELQRVRATLRWGGRASHWGGFSCCGAQALGCAGSVAVAHGLSYSVACGIYPDQGLNPCPLHWQVDS